MSKIPFRDIQQAQGFIVSQTSNIEAVVYKRRYPNYNYESFIPVLTEGNEWARSTTFYSTDFLGQADWINGAANDIPYAELTRAKGEHAYQMAGIGYMWNMEEVGLAAMLGENLSSDKADAARMIAQRKLYFIAMLGDEPGRNEKGWTGLLNDAGVTAAQVAADGATSLRVFSDKSPDQVIRDINAPLSGIYTSTNEVEMANTLLLPISTILDLAKTRIGDNADKTVLAFLRENNAYTATTGQPLDIRGSRLLETAGTSGTKRGVAYWKDPLAVRFHLPMPYRFLPPFQKSSMSFEVAGIMRTGGTEIRLPGAVRYFDSF